MKRLLLSGAAPLILVPVLTIGAGATHDDGGGAIGPPRQWLPAGPAPAGAGVYAAAAAVAPCGQGEPGTCVYVVGGDGGRGGDGALSRAERYDASDNAWHAVAPLPAARSRLAAAAAPCHGRLSDICVYAIGGYSLAQDRSTSSLFMLDPKTNRWSSQAAMGAPRLDLAAATGACPNSSRDTCLYAIGGSATGTVEVYDTATGAWSSAPPLPRPVDALGAATAPCHPMTSRSCIYALGGLPAGGGIKTPENSVEMFDPPTGVWTAEAPMLSRRSSFGAFTMPCDATSGDICLQVAGGEAWNPARGQSEALSLAEEYDPATGKWMPLPALNQARAAPVASAGPCLGAVGAFCGFTFGGFDPGISGAPPFRSVEMLKPRAAAWSWAMFGVNRSGAMATSAPCPRTSGPSFCIYQVGGGFDNGRHVVPSASVNSFDPLTGLQGPAAALPQPVQYGATITAPCRHATQRRCVYVIGGRTAGGDVAAVDMYDPATNHWTPVSSLPAPRESAAAAAAPCRDDLKNRCLYVTAGGAGSRLLPSTLMYDPSTDGWQQAAGPNPPHGLDPIGSSGPCVAALSRTCLYIVGGIDGSGTPTSRTSMYDPAQNRWVELPPYPALAGGTAGAFAPCSMDTRRRCLYVEGGAGGLGLSQRNGHEFDPLTDQWIVTTGMTGAREFGAAAVAPCLTPGDGACLYVLGGTGAGDTAQEGMQMYRPASDRSTPFSLGHVTINWRKGTATVQVSVRGAGALSLTGRSVSRVDRLIPRSQSYNLTVHPTGAVQKALRRKGKGTVRVTIAFQLSAGIGSAKSRNLHLFRRR